TASFLLPDTSRGDYYNFVEKNERVNQIWGRYLPQMIGAKSNEAALDILASTIKSMRDNGLDFVLSFNADAYQRAKTAAGMEYGWPVYRADYTAPVTGANGNFSYWKYIAR
ncbi:MAG: hypothetical protein IJR61_04255, partial [Clostridia bacterium]|nr:hypothetical protein [Clostridia bacterium]